MSQYNSVVDNNFATDAEWRTWCQAIEACLLASGFLVLASDTGQLDLTSAARPAINTLAGFRMLRTADALHATKPLYVKVEYGCGSATNRGKVQITVGTSTNGTGTLGGLVTAAQTVVNATVDGSGAATLFGGGNASSSWFCLYDGAITSSAGHFIVARLMDSADASASGQAAYVESVSGSSGTLFGTYMYTDHTVAWTTVSTGVLANAPDMHNPFSSGGDINTTLVFQASVYRNAKAYVLALVVGRAAELAYTDPAGSAFTISIWGGSHTFVPIPWGSAAGGSNGRVAMLWDS